MVTYQLSTIEGGEAVVFLFLRQYNGIIETVTF